MSTLFISHSSKDNELAREVALQLEAAGHSSIFLDLDPSKGIVAGQSWERTLYRKLRACRAVVALCTDDYLSSQWCFAEIALARMEGKYIFALKAPGLSDDARLPSILTEKQYIDMRNRSVDAALRDLSRGLEEIDLLGVSGEWDPSDPPYLGLSTFNEKHAPVFFGREDESRAGVELLDRGAPGLVMALGSSGSGKSSLVRAGIIPRLRRMPDRWIIVEPFRPGSDPFNTLAESLIGAYRRYVPESATKLGDAGQLSGRLQAWSTAESITIDPSVSVEHIAEDLRVKRLLDQLSELHEAPPEGAEGTFLNFLDWSLDDLRRICAVPTDGDAAANLSHSTPLVDIAEDLRRTSGQTEARVLLVVDQFEELLGHGGLNQRALDFLQLLRSSIETEDSPLFIIGTMRSDFLGVFQRNQILRGIDFEGLSLGPIKPQGLRKIIEEPARLGALTLEDGLVDRLIADTETPDALPLLSFTLWVLWRDFGRDGRIDLHEYDEVEGLHGAIAREADALLTSANKDALRDAFVSMARLNDAGQFARRPVAWDAHELRPVHDTLERFIQRRLVVSRMEAGVRTVEVAHEALFRSWLPLKNWLDENRSEIQLKQQIIRDAETWEAADRDRDNLWRGGRLQQARLLLQEKKLDGLGREFIVKSVQRERTLRRTILGTAMLVFVGLSGLALWAMQERGAAETARGEAVEAKNQLRLEYEQMIETVMPLAWPDDAVPGNITVNGELLQNIRHIKNGTKSLAIMGDFGKGRVIAAAHDGFISAGTLRKQKLHPVFLKLAIKWATIDSQASRILFSVGHCEIVSVSKYRDDGHLPMRFMERWGYTVDPIENLADTQKLEDASLLIVGNAWGELTPAEIAAVVEFVRQGGALVFTGIEWSFEVYSPPSQPYDPCKFNEYSKTLSPSQGVYPMNELGASFGIQFLPGTQARQ